MGPRCLGSDEIDPSRWATAHHPYGATPVEPIRDPAVLSPPLGALLLLLLRAGAMAILSVYTLADCPKSRWPRSLIAQPGARTRERSKRTAAAAQRDRSAGRAAVALWGGGALGKLNALRLFWASEIRTWPSRGAGAVALTRGRVQINQFVKEGTRVNHPKRGG